MRTSTAIEFIIQPVCVQESTVVSCRPPVVHPPRTAHDELPSSVVQELPAWPASTPSYSKCLCSLWLWLALVSSHKHIHILHDAFDHGSLIVAENPRFC